MMKNPLKEYGLFGWNYLYLLKHPWFLLKEMYRSTKWFFQRGKRGWADCDAWSLDSYISRITLEILEAQYMNPLGTPTILFSGEEWAEGESPSDEACDRRHKEWIEILKRMRLGFKSHQRLCTLDFWNPNEIIESQKIERILQERKKEGLELFAKYFDCLWN